MQMVCEGHDNTIRLFGTKTSLPIEEMAMTAFFTLLAALAMTVTVIVTVINLFNIYDMLVLVERHQEEKLPLMFAWFLTHALYTSAALPVLMMVIPMCIEKMYQMENHVLLSALNTVITCLFLYLVESNKLDLKLRYNINNRRFSQISRIEQALNNPTTVQGRDETGIHVEDLPPAYSEVTEPTSRNPQS
jgi:hypothetical protein